MSESALQECERTRSEQLHRYQARRIRTRVTEARHNRHVAGLRWPFELLQNALDAGPRDGRESVTIQVHHERSKIIFEHDSALFTSRELMALLDGGSSKDFESEVTTGRFGTGFLVTHVLAERAVVVGLLKVPSGIEQFQLTLDRGGNEDAILENIKSCNDGIRQAIPVLSPDGVPSARFEYPAPDATAVNLGFQALRRALPFLYATRPRLGDVALDLGNPESPEVWTADEHSQQPFDGGIAEYRTIRITRCGCEPQELRVYRFLHEGLANAAALVLVERTESGWRVRLPDLDAPRVYREYPLHSSGFVPISFILDGKFEPDQERSRLLMSDEDKDLLEVALRGAVVGTQFAMEQHWDGAHLLARASKPSTAFDSTDEQERQWWTDQLAEFARQLAALPIVQCGSERLPAISPDEATADFVVPRLLPNSTEDETTVERLWPLVNAATDLLPPDSDIARDWSETAEGWHGFGLQVNRITVNALAEYVREDADLLEDLRVDGSHIEWLARFLDIVGECWAKRNGVELAVLGSILPNQRKRLCSSADLKRDDGVSERLKDICAEIDFDVRGELFLEDVMTFAESSSLAYAAGAIESAIGPIVSEANVIHGAIEHLDRGLPEDEDCGPDSADLQRASVRLLGYLWDSRMEEAAPSVQKMPFMTAKLRSVRWSHDRMMMAPVSGWPETARPFSVAYPPQRVLADLYVGCEAESVPNVVAPLVAWGIALADPITSDSPAELKDRRLAAICVDECEGVVVTRQMFSQIALLQPEVLNRCQEGVEEARALLGLVLCHVAPLDPAWHEVRVVSGRKSGSDVELSVRSALWLADLRFRAWVPVPSEEGKPQKMVANRVTLEHLLEPAWLHNNDAAIRLLSEWFEFDELELRLLGLAPDDEQRKKLRNGLAKLVESGGADPNLYATLAQEVESRRRRARDVDRCRRLGLAVQDAIRVAMETYGLTLKLVDRGFDYEVSLASDDVMENAASRCEVGPYLLEVKATTTGQARLTPMQANTAAEETSRYVLCVVDLRGLSEEELDADWTAERVEPIAKVVPDIGDKVEQTCLLVEAAANSSVAIRNEGALRYEVPIAVWKMGIVIADWVRSLRDE